jgi:hypothetical protein
VLLWITAVGTTASFIKISRIVMPGPSRRTVGAGGDDVTPPRHDRPGFLVHVPVVTLALACLATGLFARPVALWLSGLLGNTTAVTADAAASVPESFFTSAKLLGAVPVLVLGVALYIAVVTKPGKRVAHRIERLAPELRTVLLFFVLGLGLFAIVAYL